MNKSSLILAAMTLSLTACVAPHGRSFDDPDAGFDAAVTVAPTRCVIDVFIIDDQIVVDQEPAPIRSCGDSVTTIRWRLERGSKYTFPNNGVVFKESSLPTGLKCGVLASGYVFKCTFDRPARGTRYSYTVTVNGVAVPLDPSMIAN